MSCLLREHLAAQTRGPGVAPSVLAILVCDDVNHAQARIDVVNHIAGFQ